MADPYPFDIDRASIPAARHFEITASDSADLDPVPRILYIQTEGTLAVRDQFGTDITYNVLVGVFPFSGVRILSTGTTATVVGWR